MDLFKALISFALIGSILLIFAVELYKRLWSGQKRYAAIDGTWKPTIVRYGCLDDASMEDWKFAMESLKEIERRVQ